ncbi:MAG: class I SAM-dependent methyltransferase [Chloroflexota bacterium]|nr:methyltransferase domain-containing protein [Dehalococcoidia bacterium]MDW8254149.1 class I SAM-dependent methyltransferase [Chloroflexota bacterium]
MSERFTGARLVPTDPILRPMRVEALARYRFFADRVQSGTVLDLGCGAGEGAQSLAEGRRVIAVDEDGATLRAARRRYPGPDFIRMDAEQLAFADGSFDGVISVEVIEHVAHPERYLAEIRRVLKPGGVVVLTTPNRLRSSPTPGSRWPEHRREYRPEELRSLLRAQFREVELWGQSVPLYERHPARRLVRLLAPFVKPVLPRALRVRALPTLQYAIRADLTLEEIEISRDQIDDRPTLVAVCQG